MQINVNKAIQSIKSVNQQLRSQLIPKAKGGQDGDRVELGGSSPKLSSGYVQLQTELSDKLASLTSLVGDSAGQQKNLTALFNDPNSRDEVQQRAQELLDGYFNVENTGDRIFDFAFSHYEGGDREEFARKFQGYIHKGFDEAEKLLGGLADVSKDTRSYIDKRIEDFINEGTEPETQAVTAAAESIEEPQNLSRQNLDKRAFIPDV